MPGAISRLLIVAATEEVVVVELVFTDTEDDDNAGVVELNELFFTLETLTALALFTLVALEATVVVLEEFLLESDALDATLEELFFTLELAPPKELEDSAPVIDD